MTKVELITPQSVELVRARIDGSLKHPVNGKLMEEFLDGALQSMIGFRVQKKQGGSYPPNPDSISQRELVYGQRACEIYKGCVVLAHDIWEDHDDIRARGEIPPTEFRVSGEQFYVKNLPPVPIIRCDATVPEQDLSGLKKTYVLIDPFYKVL